MPGESRRRLAPKLVPIDLLLDRWATWARRELDKIGYGRSISQKLIEWHERGIAPEYNLGYIENCPTGVLMIDRLVAQLVRPQHDAVCVQYFTWGSVEMKAKLAHMSVPSFRRELDRALWTLCGTLRTLDIRFDVDANIKLP